jgi:hypothetical protein
MKHISMIVLISYSGLAQVVDKMSGSDTFKSIEICHPWPHHGVKTKKLVNLEKHSNYIY